MGFILVWSVESFAETENDMNTDLIFRLQEFMEDEARSGSMDFGCITPLYVYRMWGGTVAIDEIAAGLTELRKSVGVCDF
jgi:hypothetical protein